MHEGLKLAGVLRKLRNIVQDILYFFFAVVTDIFLKNIIAPQIHLNPTSKRKKSPVAFASGPQNRSGLFFFN